eukprot:7846205-Karenia_brevis.AAC.1
MQSVLSGTPEPAIKLLECSVVDTIPIQPEQVANFGHVEAASLQHHLALSIFEYTDTLPGFGNLLACCPKMVSDHISTGHQHCLKVHPGLLAQSLPLVPGTLLRCSPGSNPEARADGWVGTAN